jgi:hypothetical protein
MTQHIANLYDRDNLLVDSIIVEAETTSEAQQLADYYCKDMVTPCEAHLRTFPTVMNEELKKELDKMA